MGKLLSLATLVVSLSVSTPAWPQEQTVTLAVDNLFCASCPYIVKQTLAAVPGVSAVEVSFESRTATVTFDDVLTNVSALLDATESVGFPSRLLRDGG